MVFERSIGPLLVGTLAVLLFTVGLGAPLLDPQEPRYAAIGREMHEIGQWVVPHLRGQPYLDKPPLLYWLVAGSLAAFGLGDAAARVVPATAAVLTVLVTYVWGRRRLGARAGVLAAAVLTLSPGFVYYGRLLTFDGLLALWVTAALCAADLASAAPSGRLLWLASAVAAGLGVMTKGPVAVALILPPLLAWRCLNLREWIGWFAVVVAVAAPWFIVVECDRPGFIAEFLWHHHVVRYASPFDHAEPAWFYLPQLTLGLFPWVAAIPFAARHADGLRYLLAAGWCVAFFSLGGCKRATYILPAYPLVALAVGAWLAERVSMAESERHVRRLVVGLSVAFVAAVTLAWPWYARKFSRRDLMVPLVGVDAPIVCSLRLQDSAGYYLHGKELTILAGNPRLGPGTVLILASSNKEMPPGWSTKVIARHGPTEAVQLIALAATQ